MKDELISFETAKLAKEKGFNEECNDYYDKYSVLGYYNYYQGNGAGYDKNSTCKENDAFENYVEVIAPTQSLLQRWLREKHKIDVYVKPSYGGYYTNLEYDLASKSGSKMLGLETTYEEALEVGLQEGLKLIKDNKL